MKRMAACLWLVVGLIGCTHPIRTDSRISVDTPISGRLSIDGPVTTRVVAEVEPKVNTPLVEMPVEGGRSPCQGPKVAIVDVDGLLVNQNLTGPYSLGENPVDLFREKLDAIAADSAVCAVVVRINSPGGGVTATDIMFRDLQAFRQNTQRPVVACLMDHGCAGGYYLATASDLILAHPTTITGGIGVVLNLYKMDDFLGMFSVAAQTIRAGKHIDMGTFLATLSPEAQQMLQGMADEFHQRFQTVIKQQRPAVDLANPTNFDGRVLSARQALERKLIDRIGYLEDAVSVARDLAKQPNARAVMYHRPADQARTPYAITPNQPLQASLIPFSLPAIDRSRLPTFLYLWQPDPTLERLTGQ